MPSVTSNDGPVAVTGASGYIGSWNVHELVEHGYHVHACVRDTSKPDKVDHLLEMNEKGLPGQVTIKQGDLLEPGSYDEAFSGCVAIMHTGTPMPSKDRTAQEIYEGCFTQIDHVLESVKKAGTLKRFVYTSSFAAVTYPAPDGHVFTESDWCGDESEDYVKAYKGMYPMDRMVAYSMGKANTERKLYRYAEQDGTFEAMGIMPGFVIGPVMCSNHDISFQNEVKRMLKGAQCARGQGGRMQWNNVDVRDIAQAHRLCIETAVAGNGSRYIVAAADDSGILYTWQMQERLKELFPQIDHIGGEEMVDGKPAEKSRDNQRAYSTLAIKELGLKPHSVDETLRDTGDSYIKLGLLPNPLPVGE